MNDRIANLLLTEIFKVVSSAKMSRNGLPLRDRNYYTIRKFYTDLIMQKKLEPIAELSNDVIQEAASQGYIDLLKATYNRFPLGEKDRRILAWDIIRNDATFTRNKSGLQEAKEVVFSWLSEQDIDWLCEQSSPEEMWTNSGKTRMRKFLFSKGIIKFSREEGVSWRRIFNPALLDVEEILDYAPMCQDVEFTDYSVGKICKCGGRSGERKLLLFVTWPGFIKYLKENPQWLTHEVRPKVSVYEYLANIQKLKEDLYAPFFYQLVKEDEEKKAKDEQLQRKIKEVIKHTISEFAKLGVDLTHVPPNERGWHDRNEYQHWHDGVVYRTYAMNREEFQEPNDITLNAYKLTELIRRHHDLIKPLYNHLKETMGEDIWVLSGGGAQLQAFYGDSKGYIGTLYLDMLNGSDAPPTARSFTINRQNLDKVLGDYKQEGIKVVTFKSIWKGTSQYDETLDD